MIMVGGLTGTTVAPFSNGLENISRRMKEINGDVNFVNEKGTKVILTIPFVLFHEMA